MIFVCSIHIIVQPFCFTTKLVIVIVIVIIVIIIIIIIVSLLVGLTHSLPRPAFFHPLSRRLLLLLLLPLSLG